MLGDRKFGKTLLKSEQKPKTLGRTAKAADVSVAFGFFGFYAPSRFGLPFSRKSTEKSLPKGKRVENTSDRRKTPKFSQKYRFLAKIGDPSENSPESMLKTRKIKKKPFKAEKKSVLRAFALSSAKVCLKYYNINKTSSTKGRFIQKTA